MPGIVRSREYPPDGNRLFLLQAAARQLASGLPGESERKHQNENPGIHSGNQEMGMYRGVQPQHLHFPERVCGETARRRKPEIQIGRIHPNRRACA